MKAIILAAGRGSRMNDLTFDKPKCMVEFKNRPLINWQIDALKSIDEKYIYIYNNNLHSETASEKVYPEILKMKFDGDDLEEVWRFDCRQFDVGDQSINGGGGNLQILSDGSLFVSMCNPYSQLFIVDSNKSILWRAIAETYNQADKTWKTYNMYRASFVTRQQLEKMIWSK